MRTHLLRITILVTTMTVLPLLWAAEAGYFEGWETSSGSCPPTPCLIAGWGPGTTAGNIEVVESGGNPGRFLRAFGDAFGTFDVGAASREVAALKGDYDGTTWTISLDLLFNSGVFEKAGLRFRYKDSTQNGWTFTLTDNFPLDEWQSFRITFDPSWTDEQARAEGWLPDSEWTPGSDPPPSFSETMSDVFYVEIRIRGDGFLDAGVDNIRLEEATPALEHFLFHRVKRVKSRHWFRPRFVQLEDQFGSGKFLVFHPDQLGNPVDKNREGVTDPETHYVAYRIKQLGRNFSPSEEILVNNQFGELVLVVEKPVSLLVPSAKSLEVPVDPLVEQKEHFKCYGVSMAFDSEPFEPTMVRLDDQFEMEGGSDFLIVKPTKLCNPVDKNSEGIIDRENHLVCYAASREVSEFFLDPITGIHTNNQFGPLVLRTQFRRGLGSVFRSIIEHFDEEHDLAKQFFRRPTNELCVPSFKELFDLEG